MGIIRIMDPDLGQLDQVVQMGPNPITTHKEINPIIPNKPKVGSPIPILIRTVNRKKTGPKLFVTSAINQATSCLNVQTDSKNYKKVILPNMTIPTRSYFFTRPYF